jgi:TetR/AcrR family tetracycline transcriptional repressor
MSAPVLSHRNAVATAIAILDADGAGALTMRRVAREMGVPLMSLYRHVPSKDDLEAGIVVALIRSVQPEPVTGVWDTDLRDWAVAYRDMAMRHPRAAALLAARPTAAYGARAAEGEAMLRALCDAGLRAEGARVHLRAALVMVTGFCNAQAAARATPDRTSPPVGPDPADHPLLARLLDDVGAGRHGPELFEVMLDAVVGSISAAIAAGPAKDHGLAEEHRA